MTTEPLDVDDLLREADGEFDGLPAGTTMGHVHLKVASIPATVEFYRDVLGFDLVVERVPQAAFLSAGGYHHHLGANTWESAGAPPPPQGSAALRHATIVLPSAEARDEVVRRVAETGQTPTDTSTGPLVRDPSGNVLVLTATAEPASAQTQ
jgi:catechol 2,3-dioxygenase